MKGHVSFRGDAAPSSHLSNSAANYQGSQQQQQQLQLSTSHNSNPGDLDLSSSRFMLPTLSARRTKAASAETTVPAAVQELSKLTPRERIKREFKMRHDAAHHQRPSHLFGKEYDKEVLKRSARKEDTAGFVSEQAKKKQEREDERQELRLARSQLAMSQSMAVAMGTEEKAIDATAKRPSPAFLNKAGADRHRFQINWADRTGADLPTMPDRWSGPGPGAYGGSLSFIETKSVKGL